MLYLLFRLVIFKNNSSLLTFKTADIYGEMTKAKKNNPELVLEYDQLPVIKFMIHGQYVYGIQWGSKFSGVYISLNKNNVLPHMTR